MNTLAPIALTKIDSSKSAFHPILTFDVEFWYEGYRRRNLISDHQSLDEIRDEATLEMLLAKLAVNSNRATFFVVGRFAEKHRAIIKKIASAGHEIATHGMEHWDIPKHLRLGGIAAFRDDLTKSKDLLEQITGTPVIGHRATAWSVQLKDYSWFFDILIEVGLKYDSSLFPASIHPYGSAKMASSPVCFVGQQAREILEIPAQVLNTLGFKWPVLGGFYIRALPVWVSTLVFKRHANPSMLYFHPYEFDETCPKMDGPFLFKLMRYHHLERPLKFLDWVLSRHTTVSLAQAVEILRPLAPRLDLSSTNPHPLMGSGIGQAK